MQELNDSNFDSEIGSGTVLVDFWSEGCGPCRMMEPVLSEIETAGVKVCKVNAGTNAALSSKYGVSAVPTFIIFKDGEVSERFLGVTSKDTLLEAAQ
tara:strand:+ start:3023 stop:3313 length:291 start_codon:yes stop_codon:yes gene_type:complete